MINCCFFANAQLDRLTVARALKLKNQIVASSQSLYTHCMSVALDPQISIFQYPMAVAQHLSSSKLSTPAMPQEGTPHASVALLM
jgi:hypothetical protein